MTQRTPPPPLYTSAFTDWLKSLDRNAARSEPRVFPRNGGNLYGADPMTRIGCDVSFLQQMLNTEALLLEVIF